MSLNRTRHEGLTGEEKEALEEFCRLVRDRLGGNVVEIRLFGSKAGGASSPVSDIEKQAI